MPRTVGLLLDESLAVIQRLYHLENKFVNLRVCNVNVWTLSGRSGWIVEMLKRWSVDICSAQKTRFRESRLGLSVGKQQTISSSR